MDEADRPPGYAFISYVREDSAKADRLQDTLEAAGVRVWRDTADLWPGEDWRAKIRQAITNDALVFIACFSRKSLLRVKSYQNEELALAIQQLRLRRPDVPWLIPVRFDDCDIPEYEIGGGRTLASIQRVDLFGRGSAQEASRLITTVLRILGPHPAASSAAGAHLGSPKSAGSARRPRNKFPPVRLPRPQPDSRHTGSISSPRERFRTNPYTVIGAIAGLLTLIVTVLVWSPWKHTQGPRPSGVSSAASRPNCGTPTDGGPYCYVMATMNAPTGQTVNSVAGTFTVPQHLEVTAPAYTIAQIAITGPNSVHGVNSIELGWAVTGHNLGVPHLFIYFRRLYGDAAGDNCQVGLGKNTCASTGDFQSLTSQNLANLVVSAPSALFYMGYDSTLGYWYIQYQNHYIARMSEGWWSSVLSNFTGGNKAEWYGEVHTDGVSCTAMGNGVLGSSAVTAANVSGMEWGNGINPMSPATATMSYNTKYSNYWNSDYPNDQTFTSSFSFGGPGDCPR